MTSHGLYKPKVRSLCEGNADDSGDRKEREQTEGEEDQETKNLKMKEKLQSL